MAHPCLTLARPSCTARRAPAFRQRCLCRPHVRVWSTRRQSQMAARRLLMEPRQQYPDKMADCLRSRSNQRRRSARWGTRRALEPPAGGRASASTCVTTCSSSREGRCHQQQLGRHQKLDRRCVSSAAGPRSAKIQCRLLSRSLWPVCMLQPCPCVCAQGSALKVVKIAADRTSGKETTKLRPRSPRSIPRAVAASFF